MFGLWTVGVLIGWIALTASVSLWFLLLVPVWVVGVRVIYVFGMWYDEKYLG